MWLWKMYLTVNPNRPLHYQHVNLENKPVSKKKKQTRQTSLPDLKLCRKVALSFEGRKIRGATL